VAQNLADHCGGLNGPPHHQSDIITHAVIPVLGCRETLPRGHSQHFLLGIYLGLFRIAAFGQMRKIDWYWEGVYGGYPAMKSM